VIRNSASFKSSDRLGTSPRETLYSSLNALVVRLRLCRLQRSMKMPSQCLLFPIAYALPPQARRQLKEGTYLDWLMPTPFLPQGRLRSILGRNLTAIKFRLAVPSIEFRPVDNKLLASFRKIGAEPANCRACWAFGFLPDKLLRAVNGPSSSLPATYVRIRSMVSRPSVRSCSFSKKIHFPGSSLADRGTESC
jgi:hypothetical protein